MLLPSALRGMATCLTSWQVLSRGPFGDRIARSCRHEHARLAWHGKKEWKTREKWRKMEKPNGKSPQLDRGKMAKKWPENGQKKWKTHSRIPFFASVQLGVLFDLVFHFSLLPALKRFHAIPARHDPIAIAKIARFRQAS